MTLNKYLSNRWAIAGALLLALCQTAHARDGESGDAHDASDAFHFTTIRTWAYRNFLPGEDDADVLGFEFNSAWGWGDSMSATSPTSSSPSTHAQFLVGRSATSAIPTILATSRPKMGSATS